MRSVSPELHNQVFVYVVESPSAGDVFAGRQEGRALTEVFRLAGIKSRYRLAVDGDHFLKALGADFVLSTWRRKAIPILHISAHGNCEGIGLTSGQNIAWQELREHLVVYDIRL